MENKHLLAHEDALAYILGGNAHFTVVGQKGHYTFHVKAKGEDKPATLFYVYDYTGTYITHIRRVYGFSTNFVTAVPKKELINTAEFQCIKHVLYFLQMKTLRKEIEIWHHGKCGVCNRTLTDPESIRLGIGPYCRNK